MNTWTKLSNLGVKPEMPIYQQKSIILYNQISRMLVVIILASSLTMYFGMDLIIAPTAFLLSLPVIATSIIFNKYGKINTSMQIITVFFPIFFVFLSIYAKLNNEGTSLIFHITPRFGIIITTILPIVIYGFNNIKKVLIGGLPGVIAFASFDYLHTLFGIKAEDIPYYPHNYPFVVFGMSLVLIFAIFIISFLQKVNRTYDKIVNNQKEEIKHKNKQITDSIKYASRIQKAVLPSSNILKNHITDCFTFFKPKEIVSGDFFYFAKKNNYLYIIAADCTGHGVPGAFMSMLGVTFLNQIINANKNTKFNIPIIDKIIENTGTLHKKEKNAADILNILREQVKNALNQTGKTQEQKDGMDMAICILDINNHKMQYAGAHNPLYIVRNKKLIEYKADRMPVGVYKKEKSFSNIEVDLKKDDSFYIFTDGFIDQFGGVKNQKFKTKQFKELLLKINNYPMQKQYEILKQTFNNWKSTIEQIDDVLVIGVKI